MIRPAPVSPSQPITEPPWLALARPHLGLHEKPGPQTEGRIADFFRVVGHPDITDDETPWCAAFVGAMLEQAGYSSSRSLLARSYLEWGSPMAAPIPGAIAIFPRGRDPGAGHVAFVIAASGSDVKVIGGNQQDQVSIRSFKRNTLIGLRWPALEPHWFQTALAVILKSEGGWSNHPQDPGGATNKGITHSTYQRAIDRQIVTAPAGDLMVALRGISDRDVAAIYERLYWQAARCPSLPGPVALMHFDAAVNHGPGRAIRFLQRSVGAAIDGEIGPETLSKAWSLPPLLTVERYKSLRLSFYRGLKTWPTFGKGWRNRLAAISNAANSSIEQRPQAPQSQFPSTQKDLKPMTTTQDQTKKWWGESLTIWGAIVTALSTILPVLGPFIGIDVTAGMIQQFGETVTQLIQIIGGLTGTGMTFYGRARAETALARRPLNLKI